MELYFLFPRAGSGIVSYMPKEIYYLFDLICGTRFMARLKVPRNSTSLTLGRWNVPAFHLPNTKMPTKSGILIWWASLRTGSSAIYMLEV